MNGGAKWIKTNFKNFGAAKIVWMLSAGHLKVPNKQMFRENNPNMTKFSPPCGGFSPLAFLELNVGKICCLIFLFWPSLE